MPATLGYVIATPSELPGVRTSQHRSPIPAFPKGKKPHQNALKHSKKELPPLGEGQGRGLRMASGLGAG